MTPAEKIVYDHWFQFLSTQLGHPYSAHIYLRCSPETSLSRVTKRSRPGEQDIHLEYLQTLHDRHEDWLSPQKDKVLTLQVDDDFLEDEKLQQSLIDESCAFLYSLK